MSRRILKRFFPALFGLAAALYLTAAARSHPVPPHPFAPGDTVLVIPHRGGLHLGPEHTMPTYRRAVEMGIDVLELDIHMSQDSALVVIHDRRVGRITNGRGAVRDLPLAELKKLDAAYHWSTDGGQTFPRRGQGYSIPALEEVFTAFPNFPMVIEIKSNESTIASTLCIALRTLRTTDKTIVSSFHGDVVNAFRAACPQVPTGATGGEAIAFTLLELFYLDAAFQPSAQAFQVPNRLGPVELIDRRFTQAARNHNMAVHVWTVNDPAEMQNLIDAGVDGIITDDPQSLLTLLNRKTI